VAAAEAAAVSASERGGRERQQEVASAPRSCALCQARHPTYFERAGGVPTRHTYTFVYRREIGTLPPGGGATLRLSPGCRVAGCCRVGLPGCRGVAGSLPGCRVCRVLGLPGLLPGAAGCCQAETMWGHFRVLPGAAGLPGLPGHRVNP
jgi:hypothetical protein